MLLLRDLAKNIRNEVLPKGYASNKRGGDGYWPEIVFTYDLWNVNLKIVTGNFVMFVGQILPLKRSAFVSTNIQRNKCPLGITTNHKLTNLHQHADFLFPN